ncbi:MAG: DUF5668 domain-containing protein [Dehalococcoidales bacterium]|nr:DUF5668 domain-containing protein [Dehalococcoidales bacterium]
MFIGLALLIIGIAALLVKAGVLPGSIWDYVWPALLILLGLTIIFGRKRSFWHSCCLSKSPGDEEKK